MSTHHTTTTTRGVTVSFPTYHATATQFNPFTMTVTATFSPPCPPFHQVTFQPNHTPTPTPTPTLLTNSQLAYLHSTLPKLRLAYQDSLADPQPDGVDQATLANSVAMLQAVLDQHAHAARLMGREVQLVDLFALLKMGDDEAALEGMAGMMSGLKL